MTEPRKNDLLTRLTELSEEAKQRLQEAPGADRVLTTLNGVRERLDDLQRRVRGLEELERRLNALEKKVDKLAKAQKATPKSPPPAAQ